VYKLTSTERHPQLEENHVFHTYSPSTGFRIKHQKPESNIFLDSLSQNLENFKNASFHFSVLYVANLQLPKKL